MCTHLESMCTHLESTYTHLVLLIEAKEVLSLATNEHSNTTSNGCESCNFKYHDKLLAEFVHMTAKTYTTIVLLSVDTNCISVVQSLSQQDHNLG